MTPEQQAAYIMAQAMCAMAEVVAMQTANQIALEKTRGWLDLKLPHDADDFRSVADRFGIHHNAVISLFTGR